MRNRIRLSYDSDHNQWYVKLGGRQYSLHCGECFDLYVGDKAYECRLELHRDWYIILYNTKFVLHRKTTYSICLDD